MMGKLFDKTTPVVTTFSEQFSEMSAVFGKTKLRASNRYSEFNASSMLIAYYPPTGKIHIYWTMT